MRVTHLSLTDFRNYTTAEIDLGTGANLFVGSNGQGKTNLVESIGYLSTLGSHRVSSDQAMIRQGTDAAIVRARLRHGDRELLAEVQLNRSSANRAQVNRSAIKPRELPRYVSSVLFAPEDLALVRGEPSGRRRFLDELLVQRAPRLSGVLADYERVLRQRNTLLKSARNSGLRGGNLSTLDIWDDRLVTLGTEIIDARWGLIEELRPHVRAAYEAVAGEQHSATLAPALSVLSKSVDDEDAHDAASVRLDAPAIEARFREALATVRRSELDRGVTLVGPHRDDLVLTLNGLPAKGYASHGESWSMALALKLASAQVLRAESPLGDPVIILDDVFAELDERRRLRLASAVQDFEQVLITAAVLGDVPGELAGTTVRIERGRVVEKLAGERDEAGDREGASDTEAAPASDDQGDG
ncbi:DNA replication/repair protein RecF [Herbiconiux sp. SYSU D00978]|uniref:DNA replication/repair protein RecF n=1 Tax=Herbiconiux sp. SYSU D00978 TaxID=2812562 RepID=UPI001A96FB59|nr:DNA replication/repair protein RecF [Herbiconiux sp. SYSU D00978]